MVCYTTSSGDWWIAVCPFIGIVLFFAGFILFYAALYLTETVKTNVFFCKSVNSVWFYWNVVFRFFGER
jgi:hypothetical protein